MKRTLGYLKPYAGRTALALFLKTAGSVSELVLPYLLSYIIDELTPLKDETAIWIAGGAMLFFSLLALFGNIAANRLSALVAGAMTRALRHDLFRKTSYLKCSQVDELTVPSLISRLTSDTYYVNQMVARTMRMGVRAPILLAGGLFFCFLLNARLALVLVAVIPVVAVPLFLITRKSVPMYLAVQRNGDRMVRTVQEDITGIRVIKALSKTEHESEKFGGIASDLASSEFRAQRVMSLTNPLTSLILNLGLVAVIVAGAFLSAEAGESAERIEKVLSLDEREKLEEHLAGDPAFAVEFKDVSFSYGGDKEHLTGISFALKKGASLGIIGPTGCGKSTVVNLLLRLYDVSAGAVYVDGQDVRSLPSEKLRKKFGVVFQNGYLMAASIRENIDYGRDLPEEAIKRAARCAQAEEFIKELPEGYGHDLAQKAGDLSGGQKQRLLIARALAASPEIVVLDDSSSALDYATDAALRRALQREYAGTTRIVVAQRVSSVKNCDLILVLENGSVTGAGTHEDLMKSCPEYRAIAETQMGEAV